MTSPDTAVFIAQAGPWSPATKGPITASAIWVDIKSEKDFEKYKGKLAGKIVLFGELREVKPVDKPLFTRNEEADLKRTSGISAHSAESQQYFPGLSEEPGLPRTGRQVSGSEQAAAVLVPSDGGRNNGGSGGTIFDDTRAAFSWMAYRREHADPLPIAVTAIEAYGRVLSPAQGRCSGEPGAQHR